MNESASAEIATRKFTKYQIFKVISSDGKLAISANKNELFDDLVLKSKKNRKYTKFNYINFENKSYTSKDCRNWAVVSSKQVNNSPSKGTLLSVESRLYVGEKIGLHYRVLDSFANVVEQGITLNSYLDLTALRSGLYMIIVGDEIYKVIK